jgi:monoamine oxidase
MAHVVDVVVVGAGFAGLAAVQHLLHQHQQKGHSNRALSIVVLEARDRVGGRALSRRITVADNGNNDDKNEHKATDNIASQEGADNVVDLGGQWVAPDDVQPRICALAHALHRPIEAQLYPGAVDGSM